MIDSNLYSLSEDIKNKDYILATYYIELDKDVNIIRKAESMAIGQTIGTWVPIPGITEEMRKNHMGKVVNIMDAPPYELYTQIQGNLRSYFIQIAYPTINFGPQFPMMLTTLLGNDASTSAQVKLVDLQLPESFVNHFTGPKFGIEGLRNLTGVYDRPLILNMIKPCTGITPELGAKIFYETALGGVDFIKDDELLGNPDFCKAADRVKAYNRASKAAYEKTGKEVIYICNITDSSDRILDTLKAVQEAGAKAVMMCFSTIGYSQFQHISEQIEIPVMGHYAASSICNEGILNGLGSHLSVGKFPRLAGADLVMMNTPYGGYPLTTLQYFKTALQLTLPYYNLKPTMPICGGGVHPGMVQRFIDDFGSDIILAAGGAIQGHPMGATAGAQAMLQATEAAMKKLSLDVAAEEHKELKVALEQFKH
ncbi:RuBisCO large subunit C-terminal-like domain-containing protein [Clostridium sp. AL.422]|uniref:RuBisCO large subunit C-terminal-like domain-containing protein n=1 Tax=Clostridium TaxID=1485 RepID=UPI00293DC744|nr:MULTISPECIES: RuBisCO large subunit C-terminal-like domain-containing protein [unclassified Clostridium]MDV4149952.1 RuBisCO large subunit C-terminal-like domain-containing protein [Clostridium sp. AL.422]